MEKLFIICVDDQQEVLNALEKDLIEFDASLNLEVCDTANEALELMDEIDQNGNFTALVISDQVMPEMNGVEFLAQIEADDRFKFIRKVLLTGQATHQDTIEAINIGGIDKYVAKPWSKEEMVELVKTLVTGFIFDKGLNHESYREILDQQVVLEEMRKRTI